MKYVNDYYDKGEKELIEIISNNLKLAREKNNLKQGQLLNLIEPSNENSAHSKVSAWENPSTPTLPSLVDFAKICTALDTDMNYICGKTDIQSAETLEISKLINVSQKNIKTLKQNKDYGQFLNYFIESDLFSKFLSRINQLAISSMLKSVIDTTLTSKIIKQINILFEKYYSSTLPLDLSKENWTAFLKLNLKFKDYNSLFIDEGKNALKNRYPTFNKLNDENKINCVYEVLADITFDYKLSEKQLELSKIQIQKQLMEIIDLFISKESEKRRNKLKNTYSKK